jgi:hypothetical protein
MDLCAFPSAAHCPKKSTIQHIYTGSSHVSLCHLFLSEKSSPAPVRACRLALLDLELLLVCCSSSEYLSWRTAGIPCTYCSHHLFFQVKAIGNSSTLGHCMRLRAPYIYSTMCTSPHYHHAVQISIVKAQILRDPVVPRRRGTYSTTIKQNKLEFSLASKGGICKLVSQTMVMAKYW